MISYNKLWKLLIDKRMKKKDFMKEAGISEFTVRKLNSGENMTTDVLVRICKALNCDVGDIMEIIHEDSAQTPQNL